MIKPTLVQQIKQWLGQADVLLIHTGAGMSADSGLPVYRGENGAWGQLEGELQGDIREIMTPAFISENPLYMWRRFARGRKREHLYPPHKGYYILLDWIEYFQLDYFCVTSNVDSMFQKAGFAESQILEIHGSGRFQQCTIPCHPEIWDNNPQFDPESLQLKMGDLPHCPYCGALARPNVLIFKDKTFVSERVIQQKAAHKKFISQYQDSNILIIEIGVGMKIKTIRRYTDQFTASKNARVIRINPDFAEVESPHVGLPFKALDTLAYLDQYFF